MDRLRSSIVLRAFLAAAGIHDRAVIIVDPIAEEILR